MTSRREKFNLLRETTFLNNNIAKGLTGVEIANDNTIILHFPTSSIIGCCHHGQPLKGFSSANGTIWGCSMYGKNKKYHLEFCDYIIKPELINKTGYNAVWLSTNELVKYHELKLIRVIDILAGLYDLQIDNTPVTTTRKNWM